MQSDDTEKLWGFCLFVFFKIKASFEFDTSNTLKWEQQKTGKNE